MLLLNVLAVAAVAVAQLLAQEVNHMLVAAALEVILEKLLQLHKLEHHKVLRLVPAVPAALLGPIMASQVILQA